MSPVSAALMLFVLLWVRDGARCSSSLTGFEPPQIDGSAVDDICRIFLENTPEPGAASTAAPTAASRTTAKQTRTSADTKKPAVQSQERKPESNLSKAPIRTQPAAGGPISNQHSNDILRLLSRLLASRRGHASAVQRNHNHVRTNSNNRETWKVVSSSSEDSSDES